MNRCEMCMKNTLHPAKKCCFNRSRSSSNRDVWHNCGEDCPGWDNAVKTNADRIRAMNDEELIKLLTGFCAFSCISPDKDCEHESCEECLKEWLQSPEE